MPDTPEMQGAQTTTSDDVPNQIPTPDTQAQPSLFQQAMQGAVQPTPTQQPTAPQPDPQQVRQARDKAIEFHPAVTAAHVARKIGEAIEGGPQYKEDIDPATGAVTRTPIPPSTKSILLGSLANILGSVGQVSGNLSARMQGRAPAPIQPLPTQQAQQQRDQMTEEDFNRVQNQRVRQAKILNSNLESMRLSYALRHEEDSALDQTIANHADDLANWNKSGAVESSKIPSSELLSKGFDKSKYLAIPDGYVPVHDKDGNRVISKDGLPVSELTYSVVDGTTQAPLTQDKYDQLAKYGLMTGKEGFKVPEGGTISSAQLALMNNKLGLIQQTQRELDSLHDAVGGNKVDLASEIKKNPKLLSALEQFHNSASDDPVQQLASLRASNNPKAQAAVGPLISLFGNDNLNKWTARNQQPPDSMDPNKAQQIVSDPRTDKSSPAYKTASAFLKDTETRQNTQKQTQTRLDAAAKTQAEGKDVEAMYKNGVNPITKEKLSLDNSPDEFLVDQRTGNPIPTAMLSTVKPTMQEINRHDFATSVLHSLDEIDKLQKAGKLPNGPLSGLTQQKLSKAGMSTENAQEALNFISFAQSAATGAHVGGRFSLPVMEKMNGMIGLNMNSNEFKGAEESIRDVMGQYKQNGGRMTVAEYKALPPEEQQRLAGANQQPASSKQTGQKPATQPQGGNNFFSNFGGKQD